ncbi:MAG: serine/threonine-protein kinase, partial [Planctomyces sp.]
MKFTFGPDTRPLDGITIKRAIHRGGFGEVYYAVTDAGKEVALKLLHNNLEVELRGVSQCLNLKHPNLVTIFDIRQDAERDHWIVMEYVGGQSLHDALQQHPDGMPLQQVLNWLTGMTAGLNFLHDRGLVHRDLKPANIFSDGGVVKVGDVGLSKFISESRRSAQTQSVGTVYYMAPEVARGRYGREVDVYSLGIMLYEMMTGRVPFEGESAGEILMKHLTAEPDLRLLPTPLRAVLAAALEKDPERRIHDVETLQQRFREAVTATGLPLQQPAVCQSLQTDEMFPGSRPAVRQPAAGGSA